MRLTIILISLTKDVLLRATPNDLMVRIFDLILQRVVINWHT